MKMKTVSKIFLGLSLLGIALTGCTNQNNNGGQDLDNSNPQGLEFLLTPDNTYYVSHGSGYLLENIVIPETYYHCNVTGIYTNGFESCARLKTISLPKTITVIKDHAFLFCAALETIVIPLAVTTIENNAFATCASLTIYCEATSKPEGWDDNWNPMDRPVVWGYRA